MNIGDTVEIEQTLNSGKKLRIRGVVYGRVPSSQGGPKWLVKPGKVIDPPFIGVRNLYEKESKK